MSGNTVAVIGVLAALVSPVLGFLAAWWKMRGKISSSTAEDLWKANRDLRQFQKEDNDALRSRMQLCEAEARDLRRQNENLKRQVIRMQDQLESAGILERRYDEPSG